MVLSDLKQRTAVPILLPSYLPALADKSIFVSVSGDTGEYKLLLQSDPDCDHAQVCFQGIFSATKGGSYALPKSVKIGTTEGRYQGPTCGGSCSPPTIEWKSYDVLYFIQLNLLTGDERETQNVMIKLAEDAIRCGPR
jgi:hypothetical protein